MDKATDGWKYGQSFDSYTESKVISVDAQHWRWNWESRQTCFCRHMHKPTANSSHDKSVYSHAKIIFVTPTISPRNRLGRIFCTLPGFQCTIPFSLWFIMADGRGKIYVCICCWQETQARGCKRWITERKESKIAERWHKKWIDDGESVCVRCSTEANRERDWDCLSSLL